MPNDGRFVGDLSMKFPTSSGEHDVAGYWLIPVCVILGILSLRATHSLARRFLTYWRERRALAGTGHFVG